MTNELVEKLTRILEKVTEEYEKARSENERKDAYIRQLETQIAVAGEKKGQIISDEGNQKSLGIVRPTNSQPGQTICGTCGSVKHSFSASSPNAYAQNNVKQLQSFTADGVTQKKAWNIDAHNPQPELTFDTLKKISSVVDLAEHLERTIIDEEVQGPIVLDSAGGSNISSCSAQNNAKPKLQFPTDAHNPQPELTFDTPKKISSVADVAEHLERTTIDEHVDHVQGPIVLDSAGGSNISSCSAQNNAKPKLQFPTVKSGGGKKKKKTPTPAERAVLAEAEVRSERLAIIKKKERAEGFIHYVDP